MSAKIAVYALWFLFGLWSYITLFVVAFAWSLTVKTRKKQYDFYSNLLNIIFWILAFIGQIFTIYLYVDSGKSLVNNGEEVTTFYWVLLVYNFVIIIAYIFFLFFFSNNFLVKFTEEKFYIVSISILNSSIIKVARTPKKHLVIEYVYKKEANKIWTEKLIFHKWFSSAKFIEENYLAYFDPARNKALFEIAKVTKSEKSFVSNFEDSTPVSEKEVQNAKVAKPLSTQKDK